jgi:hypothetical protein
MKNNKIKSVKRAPKSANRSKVYTQKKPAKPAKKAKLTLKETAAVADINNVPAYNSNDTYTTQSNSNTTYITVEGDTLSKYPVTTVSDNSDLLYPTPNDNLKESYDKYSKVAEEQQPEDTKRSEMLPSNNEHTNMIVILIGIAAFAALLLLLI